MLFFCFFLLIIVLLSLLTNKVEYIITRQAGNLIISHIMYRYMYRPLGCQYRSIGISTSTRVELLMQISTILLIRIEKGIGNIFSLILAVFASLPVLLSSGVAFC